MALLPTAHDAHDDGGRRDPHVYPIRGSRYAAQFELKQPACPFTATGN